MYTHMTAVSKNVYVDKPDEINTTTYITKKNEMKPADVKPGGYIDFDVESNEKGPKLKVNDHVRISKY